MNEIDLHLPTYSLQSFSAPDSIERQFQVEIFDANRHFAVRYPHRHDFFEVLYLQKGSGFHVIDSNRYAIKPPCIFFMSPGQAHKLELSQDIQGFIYIFTSYFYLFKHNNQNRLLEFPFFFTIHQKNPPLILEEQKDQHFIESLFVRAIEETAKPEGYSINIMQSILDLLLVSAESLYKNMADQNILRGKGHLLVKRFFQLLEENYQNNLSVNEYASMLAITPNHLTQTLKQLTGKTANLIIRDKQLLEIKRLIVHTNLSITEIAHRLNFSDQSYFTKFFKRCTGMTPLLFRTESMKIT